MVKRKYLVSIIMVSLAITLLLVGCSGNVNSDKASGDNVLTQMFSVTNDKISLNNIEFLMSKDEVIKNKQLDINDLEVNTETQIVKNISIDNISQNAREVYEFQDNQLVSTYIVMLVDKDKYSDVRNQIYQYVLKFMPATDASNIEDIKEGKNTVMWLYDDIQVLISFPDSGQKDMETIAIAATPVLPRSIEPTVKSLDK